MSRVLLDGLLAAMKGAEEERHPDRNLRPDGSSKTRTVAESRRSALKIVGVGGAGVNILSRTSKREFEGVDVIAVDMDAVHLMVSSVSRKILLVTSHEMSAGAEHSPADGRNAAIQTEQELRQSLHGARAAVLICGLGGGTGTGAAPVIARIARDAGLMTAAVCIWPFAAQGRIMEMNAERGITKMMKEADLVVLIPNEMITRTEHEATLNDVFAAVDSVIVRAVTDTCRFFFDLGTRS